MKSALASKDVASFFDLASAKAEEADVIGCEKELSAVLSRCKSNASKVPTSSSCSKWFEDMDRHYNFDLSKTASGKDSKVWSVGEGHCLHEQWRWLKMQWQRNPSSSADKTGAIQRLKDVLRNNVQHFGGAKATSEASSKATSEASSGDQDTKGSPKLLKAKEAAKAAYLALQEVEQDQDEDDGLSDSSIDLCAPPGAGERPKPGSWQPARLSSLAKNKVASVSSGSEDAPASEGEGTSEGVDGEFAGDEEAEGEEEEGEPDEALSDEGMGQAKDHRLNHKQPMKPSEKAAKKPRLGGQAPSLTQGIRDLAMASNPACVLKKPAAAALVKRPAAAVKEDETKRVKT